VLLANHPKGSEDQAANSMETFWRAMSKAQLYKNWVGGITRGLFFEGGLYNSAPMQSFLKDQFEDITLKRMMDIGIVDVKDGSYKDFNEKNVTESSNGNAKLSDALYASMSFAGFFPPAEVLGSYYFDGSAVWDIDIFSAVNRCKE